MEVRGFRSALFIDTSARLCNLPAGTGTVTFALKTVLLMLCNVVVAYIVSADLFCTDFNRSCIVSICCWVFTGRVVVQMTFFWKRSIPWKEVVLESGGIIPLSLLTIACGCRGTVLCLEAEGLDVMHIAGGWLSLVSRLSGAHIDQSSSTQDCIGNQLAETDYLCLLMFFVGTYVNIWPEFQRYLWKRRPENARRLYTESLFAYARHVNYTGEILSFVGLCLLTGNMWTLWVPACMGAGLATFSIWEIEFYLQQRYAKEWPKYCRDTKALLVPGIY
jgi:protein-S-isoprenylcysteine O-methyltransferase Ste14